MARIWYTVMHCKCGFTKELYLRDEDLEWQGRRCSNCNGCRKCQDNDGDMKYRCIEHRPVWRKASEWMGNDRLWVPSTKSFLHLTSKPLNEDSIERRHQRAARRYAKLASDYRRRR